MSLLCHVIRAVCAGLCCVLLFASTLAATLHHIFLSLSHSLGVIVYGTIISRKNTIRKSVTSTFSISRFMVFEFFWGTHSSQTIFFCVVFIFSLCECICACVYLSMENWSEMKQYGIIFYVEHIENSRKTYYKKWLYLCVNRSMLYDLWYCWY